MSNAKKIAKIPPYIGQEPLSGSYYAAECVVCGWVGSSEVLTDDCQCTQDVGGRFCLGYTEEIGTDRLLEIVQAMARRDSESQQADLLEPAKGTGDDPGSQSVFDDDAYKRLLPKLLELSEKIDDMSESEYGDWVNALPKDEFFEFIGASHDAESFNAAVSAARQLFTKSRAVVSDVSQMTPS